MFCCRLYFSHILTNSHNGFINCSMSGVSGSSPRSTYKKKYHACLCYGCRVQGKIITMHILVERLQISLLPHTVVNYQHIYQQQDWLMFPDFIVVLLFRGCAQGKGWLWICRIRPSDFHLGFDCCPSDKGLGGSIIRSRGGVIVFLSSPRSIVSLLMNHCFSWLSYSAPDIGHRAPWFLVKHSRLNWRGFGQLSGWLEAEQVNSVIHLILVSPIY